MTLCGLFFREQGTGTKKMARNDGQESYMRDQKGFTLLETLVAFMVLSIVLVVILQVFSGGIRSGYKSGKYLYGTFHARAKMEELMMTDTAPGDYEGRFGDGYRWEARVSLIDGQQEGQNGAGLVRMAVSVKVSWQERGQSAGVELHSLKLVPAEG